MGVLLPRTKSTTPTRCPTRSSDGVEHEVGVQDCSGGTTLVCVERDFVHNTTRLISLDEAGDLVTSTWFPDVGGLPFGSGDHVWLRDDEGSSVAVDIHGNVLSGHVPGSVWQVSSGHLLLNLGRDSDLRQQLVVHPIR